MKHHLQALFTLFFSTIGIRKYRCKLLLCWQKELEINISHDPNSIDQISCDTENGIEKQSGKVINLLANPALI